MIRRLFSLLAWAGLTASGAEVAPQLSPAQAAEPPVHVERAEAAPAKAVVYTVTDPGVISGYDSDPAAERRMVDRLVVAVTGARDLREGWSSLVQPTDVVGLKVSAAGGRYFSTHPGLVAGVVSGLQSAGVPPNHIVIWDRHTEDLREAGFFERRNGVLVRGIDPPRGFDPEAKIVAPMLGMLIWGDVGFRGKETGLRRLALQQSQVSSESHLPKILSKQVTKIVNLPTFSDERGCGIAGAMYNVTVPNLDNSRRFTQGTGASSICDLYADPRLGGKVVLTIVDGLLAQYAGGPEFNPNYTFAYRTLLASKDPVALDATLARKMEKWRLQANLPSLVKTTAWLQEAETIGLGVYDAARITVKPLPWP